MRSPSTYGHRNTDERVPGKSTPGGAKLAAAVRSAKFFDCACRLPEIARIFIMPLSGASDIGINRVVPLVLVERR
jgi:hypothetical protein